MLVLRRAGLRCPGCVGQALPPLRRRGTSALRWRAQPRAIGGGGGVGAAERGAVPRGLLGGVAASILRLRGAGARAEADRVRAGVLPETETCAEKILLGPKRAMDADVYMDSEVSSEEEATVAGALPARGAPNQMVQAHALFATNLAESVTSDRLAALFQAVAPARPRPARAVSHGNGFRVRRPGPAAAEPARARAACDAAPPPRDRSWPSACRQTQAPPNTAGAAPRPAPRTPTAPSWSSHTGAAQVRLRRIRERGQGGLCLPGAPRPPGLTAGFDRRV